MSEIISEVIECSDVQTFMTKEIEKHSWTYELYRWEAVPVWSSEWKHDKILIIMEFRHAK